MKKILTIFSCLATLSACDPRISENVGRDSIQTTLDTTVAEKKADPCLAYTDTTVLSVLKRTGLCTCGDKGVVTDSNGTVYGACDPFYFTLRNLTNSDKAVPLYLVEIRGPQQYVGTGGYHNYIFKEENGQLKKVNFFQGYVDSVYKNKTYSDLSFSVVDIVTASGPYSESCSLQLSWDGDRYRFRKVLKVSDHYMDNDCTVVKKKYNPEFNDPNYWKFLSEKP